MNNSGTMKKQLSETASLLESSPSDYAIIRVPKTVLSNEFRTQSYDPPTKGEHPVIGDWVSANAIAIPRGNFELSYDPSSSNKLQPFVLRKGEVLYSNPGDFSDVDLRKVDQNLIILFEYGGWLAVPHVKAQTVKQWVKQLQADRRQSAEKKKSIKKEKFAESIRKSNGVILGLLQESTSTLTARERRLLNNAIHKEPILGGNEKVGKLGKALAVLTRVLSDSGFVLDMVPGDLLLGDKGNRALSFRRALPEGSDPFDEGQEVDSKVSFNWENLDASNSQERQFDAKRYEVVVYLT
jgi:hypothetical protein